MEGTNEGSLVFDKEQERLVKGFIKEGNFDKAIRALGFFSDEKAKEKLLDKNEIIEWQGNALLSLAKIIDRDKQMTEKEREIANRLHIQKNTQTAILCYTKSVMYGCGEAANKLFNIYYKNRDGFQDFDKAYQMAQIGVELFHTPSYYNMGKIYYDGLAVKRDSSIARHYFEISFMESGKLGGYELGMIYERGWGVAVNQSKAFDYFYSAAECGDRLATFKIGAILSGFYQDKYTAITPRPKEAVEYFETYLRYCPIDKRANALTSIGKIQSKSNKDAERAAGIKKLVREARRGDEFATEYLKKETEYGDIEKTPKAVDLSVLDA